jgi:hypothetical protein
MIGHPHTNLALAAQAGDTAPMGVSRWRVLVVLAVGAAGSVPVLAAGATKPVVVARDANATITAHDDEHLCVVMRDGKGSEVTACGFAEDGLILSDPQRGVVQIVGVVAPAPAVSVEIRRDGKLLGRAATSAGEAYTGRQAGKLRFAIVRLAPGTPGDGLRAHARDAAGTLIGVLQAGTGGTRVSGARRVLSGRRGRASWTVVERSTSELEPSVLDLAHETVARCVDVTVQTRGSARFGERQSGRVNTLSGCTSDVPAHAIQRATVVREAGRHDRCRPDFRLLHGVVAPSVRRVTVLLGDGRRRSVRTVALRDADRTYAVAIASTDAVRGVTLHADGAADVFRRLAFSPVAVFCATQDADGDHTGLGVETLVSGINAPVSTVGPVATLPGLPAVRIADGPGDTLCLAPGKRPFTALDCGFVAALPGAPLGSNVASGEFVRAVPANVAAVRFRSAGGSVLLTIPTVAAAGYAGRYAGAVRFAAGVITDIPKVAFLELLDADGAILYRREENASTDSELRPGRSRRVAGRVGGPSLWQTPLTVGSVSCLKLTAGPPPPANEFCAAVRQKESLLLDVSCTTRRLTVAVAVRPGTRVLIDTGVAAPRHLRLQNGAGLLTLRPGTRLRTLTFIRKGRTRSVRLNAPPAARQCDWSMGAQIRLAPWPPRAP